MIDNPWNQKNSSNRSGKKGNNESQTNNEDKKFRDSSNSSNEREIKFLYNKFSNFT